MSVILDGKKLAEKIQHKISEEISELKKNNIVPGLAVVMVGDNPASAVYVRNKKKKCGEVGIKSIEHHLPDKTRQSELIDLIKKLNKNKEIDGILVQLPLPKHIDNQLVLESILPEKDVDGFHPQNIGRLVLGEEAFVACTPLGVMAMIDSVGYNLKGKDAVVIGRSNIVGKPMAILLMQRDATVTICHSKTNDLKNKIGSADVVVAAIGRPGFVRGEWIKNGALVIDVGINRTNDNKLLGDVEFNKAKERAAYITPVPGGVGPMTITMLLQNTLVACKRRHGL